MHTEVGTAHTDALSALLSGPGNGDFRVTGRVPSVTDVTSLSSAAARRERVLNVSDSVGAASVRALSGLGV